jgi:HSP20 family protein
MSEQTRVPAATDGKSTTGRTAAWDPIKRLEEMRAEMARLWGEAWPFGPWTTAAPLRRLVPAPTAWAPRVDAFEKDGQIVVKAELPGMKREEIEVAFEEGDLVVKGERKAESEIKEEDYYRLERSHGSFYRRIPMPEGTDPARISATYHDGVLEVRVPLPAGATRQATKIPIS